MQTRFNPSQHGFHFSNNSITWSYAGSTGRQLCGGMSFAALDYYYANQTIPPDTSPPAEGTPLHGFITRRQFEAHGFAFPYFTSSSLTDREKYSDAMTRQFGLLKPYLDREQPYPILLDGGASPSRSHWVVAIGYDLTPGASTVARLHVYDNNQPDIVRQLTPDPAAHRWNLTGGAGFFAFVAGTSYRFVRPTAEELNRPAHAGQVLRGTSVGGHNIGAL